MWLNFLANFSWSNRVYIPPAGNRTSHYRKPTVGVTLVHFLGNRLPLALARFQARVEEALPGMYDWFKPESLHVTVRALT